MLNNNHSIQYRNQWHHSQVIFIIIHCDTTLKSVIESIHKKQYFFLILDTSMVVTIINIYLKYWEVTITLFCVLGNVKKFE